MEEYIEEKFVPLETTSLTVHGFQYYTNSPHLTTMYTGNYTINYFINQAYISPIWCKKISLRAIINHHRHIFLWLNCFFFKIKSLSRSHWGKHPAPKGGWSFTVEAVDINDCLFDLFFSFDSFHTSLFLILQFYPRVLS